MKKEDKQLLLADLCARLPYGVKVIRYIERNNKIEQLIPEIDLNLKLFELYTSNQEFIIKPYLRPMSSMTEDEAKEIAILYGIKDKDILSIKITDEYIDFVVDDGLVNTEIKRFWYDEIVSSIKIFDWLNKHNFDYRGLIQKCLAIEASEDMYKH